MCLVYLRAAMKLFVLSKLALNQHVLLAKQLTLTQSVSAAISAKST